jgi:hypothetical protein
VPNQLLYLIFHQTSQDEKYLYSDILKLMCSYQTHKRTCCFLKKLREHEHMCYILVRVCPTYICVELGDWITYFEYVHMAPCTLVPPTETYFLLHEKWMHVLDSV